MVAQHGDNDIKRGLGFWRAVWPERHPAACLAVLGERLRLLRLWQGFFTRCPVLVLTVSTELPFEWDEDTRDLASARRIILSQRAMLAVSALGLLSLSVPTGLHQGLPTVVQVVAAPCREDLWFGAGEIIERHAPMPTAIDPR